MKFEIQPREVTISDVKVADKTYDGTMISKITNAGAQPVNYDGDNLAIVIGKAAYADKNVGTDKAVSFTGFELAGSAAGNRQLDRTAGKHDCRYHREGDHHHRRDEWQETSKV